MRANGHVYDARWQLHELDLEEIVLAYLGQHASGDLEPRGGGVVIWLGWRQQRTETLITAALLRAAGGAPRPGRHPSRVALHAPGHRRTASAANTAACHEALANFASHAGVLRSVLGWFTLLPGMIGVALAAPLLLDLENGTFRLAWTQSVTRRPLDRDEARAHHRDGAARGRRAEPPLHLVPGAARPRLRAHGPAVFDVEGTVPARLRARSRSGSRSRSASLWRRTAPALVVAFAAYVGARLFVDSSLRQRLVAARIATWRGALGRPGPRPRLGAVAGAERQAGHPFTGRLRVFQLRARSTGDGIKSIDPACIARHGAGFNRAVYVPASSFWALQGIETALFGGIGLALIAFSAWWLHRRAA